MQDEKTSFQQGVQRSEGVCPSKKGNRVFQEEAAAGAEVYRYEGACAVGGTVSGCDWLKGRLCVCTQNVCVHVCLYICVSYVWGRVRRGSEREDGATMTDWREFGLDSAGKGESCRLSAHKLIR